MARNNDRDRGTKRAPKDLGRRTRKKACLFCTEHITWVDYKEVGLLRKYISDRGKIRARRVSGNCAQHQRAVAIAIKTARELALLPYAQRTVTERAGGRGGGRGGPRSDRFGDGESRSSAAPDGGAEPMAGGGSDVAVESTAAADAGSAAGGDLLAGVPGQDEGEK